MRRKRLIWRLYISIFLTAAVTLVAVTWLSSRSIRRFHLEKTAENLEARAKLVRVHAAAPIAAGAFADVDSLCKLLGRASRTRITLILPSGVVVGDSDENPAEMQDHSDRPEFQDALLGRTGRSVRFSATLRRNLMYVAVPLETPRGVTGVVRTAVPLRSIDDALEGTYRDLAVEVLILAIAAAVVSLALSRRITKPLEELKRGAERFASGDFRAPLPVADSEETVGLVGALNSMAARLDERLGTLIQQRNEREAVLASMVESVLAIDADERVINLNHATEELFGIEAKSAEGRPLQEVIRNPELQRLAASTLSSDRPVEGEIAIYGDEERILQGQGTVLRDARGEKIGALLVLYDITRLRRLERVRRDFVANVSHELRTPITTIKGFVETLLAGAIENEQDARRFLGIIAKHTERLDSIIEDLLALSRLEQEAEKAEIVLEKRRVTDVIQSAVEVCRPMARSRNVELRAGGDRDVECPVNARLLEQAIVNLLDNAIKYSDPGSAVDVAVSRADSEVVITVEDRGCGIEKRHLPRLFERFYRTDRARSRELGGTGLGLAIVKHIALVHGGRVEVESEPGRGSVFSIRLTA